MLNFHFTVPLNYSRHIPGSVGDTLQIWFSPTASNGIDATIPDREVVKWTPDPAIPLSELSYDKTPDGGSRLTLRFRKDLRYRVTPGGDFRSISVELIDPDKPAVVAAEAPVERPAEARKNGGAFRNGDPASKPSTPLDLARQAVIKEDWPAALNFYSKVEQTGDPENKAEAVEMLGLARERLGQGWRARQEYERFLVLFPKGEGANRVKQRIVGLENASKKEKEKLAKNGKEKVGGESGKRWELNGAISQYYYQGGMISDYQDHSTMDTSLLLNNFSLNGRVRTDRMDVRGRFDGRYRDDFIHHDETNRQTYNQFRVSNFYLDLNDRPTGLSTRLGRQTRSTGGVLGRFDGGLLSYKFHPQFQVNMVGGFPVRPFRATNGDPNLSFYGLSLDFGPFADYWAGNAYIINQDDNRSHRTDRRAIGGEMRYQHPVHPVFTQIDYDILFRELNILQAWGNWNFDGGAILHANIDYHRTPILGTSNLDYVLQAAGIVPQATGSESIFELNARLACEARLNQRRQELVVKTSGNLKTATIGGIVPVADKLQLNADAMWSNMSGSNPVNICADIPGILATNLGNLMMGTGDQFSYSAQLIGNGLIAPGDIWTLGLRYYDNNNNKGPNIISMYMDGRYPIDQQLRVDPRLRVDYYTAYSGWNGSEMVRVRPALRMTYNVLKSLSTELEGGFEWSDHLVRDRNDTTGYFFSAGYRWNF
ncbi:MAG: hypothetical protein FIB02_02915 [Desulfuromonas sp.]|nr:hypothetical protein [Desulfuromonas sp.]